MFPLAGITQVPVGENHAFSIETEVAVNVVLLRKINPMNRVRKPLRAAAFPEKEDTLGHMLEMSDDRFHDPAEHAATLAALSPYPFFGVRGQAERIFLFREGRSTEGFPNPVHGIYLTEENYVYGDLCLNAEGMVLSNGDLSYARQREHALCPCGKLMQYLRMTLKKRQKERLYE
jgi:hypothetical protein